MTTKTECPNAGAFLVKLGARCALVVKKILGFRLDRRFLNVPEQRAKDRAGNKRAAQACTLRAGICCWVDQPDHEPAENGDNHAQT